MYLVFFMELLIFMTSVELGQILTQNMSASDEFLCELGFYCVNQPISMTTLSLWLFPVYLITGLWKVTSIDLSFGRTLAF